MVELKGFSFLVLAYNHQEYIIEHLESIRLLIQSYGTGIEFEIIINDDCSKDSTVSLVNAWLDMNDQVFSKVVKLYNAKNIGTCASVINMLDAVSNSYYKITAGDDVYSFENIFELAICQTNDSIASGLPLDLTDGVITKKLSDILGIISSQVIYEEKSLVQRFKYLSNNNAPNIFYPSVCLSSPCVKRFLRGFDVVEDWPLQVSIAENYPDSQFVLVDKVYVYYRRTSGSTYIVAHGRFYSDKCKLFEYLISKEKQAFTRLVLRSRYFCFRSSNSFIRRFCNLALLVFGCSVMLNLPAICRRFSRFDSKLRHHQQHYSHIAQLAAEFVSKTAS